MTISVSGLGSGLAYDEWIEKLVAIKQAKIDEVSSDVKAITYQESALATIKSAYTSLLTSIQTFTSSLSSTSAFNQKAVTSSNTDVSAAVTSAAELQNLKVSVEQLATATTVKSASVAGSYAGPDTALKNISAGAITEGSFTLYINGAKKEITIDSDTTLGTLATQIDGYTGVTASVSEDGRLIISGETKNDKLTIGSSSDTSNFANVMSLTQKDIKGEIEGETITSYSSSKSLFQTDTSATLAGTDLTKNAKFALGGITTGKFTIGSAEFEIETDTTLDVIIKEINANENAGVTAFWDSNSGKLMLEAKDGGAISVNVESDIAGGGSNFTYIMGLTTSDGQNLAAGSQTLGTNAKLTINGTSITSSSNTVTSDISGITGLTLTLNKETTATANIAITSDATAATAAIGTFVEAFNNVISKTDSATASGGRLYGESLLTSLRNRLRTLVTSNTNNETYSSLATIGITTGAIGTSVSSNTDKLVIDSKKLAEALAKDPEAISKLFVGDTKTGTKGVLSDMKTVLDNSLDPVNGFFVKRQSSYEKSADRLNDKVDRMTVSLKSYQKQLEAKFAAMDKIISNLQDQSSLMTQYLKQTSKNNDDD